MAGGPTGEQLAAMRNRGLNGGFTVKPPKPAQTNRLRRLFVFLRRLVRRRQETAMVKAVRAEGDECRRELLQGIREAADIIADRDRQIEELKQTHERKVDDLQGQIKHWKQTITEMREVEIEKLKNKIEVLEDECLMLAELHERSLKRVEKDTSVYNAFAAVADGRVEEQRLLSQARVPGVGTVG